MDKTKYIHKWSYNSTNPNVPHLCDKIEIPSAYGRCCDVDWAYVSCLKCLEYKNKVNVNPSDGDSANMT